MTQTPVATIVRPLGYNRLPWLWFADNFTIGVSYVSSVIYTGFLQLSQSLICAWRQVFGYHGKMITSVFNIVPLDGSASSVTMELDLCATLEIGLASIFYRV